MEASIAELRPTTFAEENENLISLKYVKKLKTDFDFFPDKYYNIIIGKKVEVSLRLFDIFERNRVFIFSCESWESPPSEWALQ